MMGGKNNEQSNHKHKNFRISLNLPFRFVNIYIILEFECNQCYAKNGSRGKFCFGENHELRCQKFEK